jgi:hypothetical protein
MHFWMKIERRVHTPRLAGNLCVRDPGAQRQPHQYDLPKYVRALVGTLRVHRECIAFLTETGATAAL